MHLEIMNLMDASGGFDAAFLHLENPIQCGSNPSI